MESLSTLQQLHFLRPLWFLALIPAGLLIGFLVKNKQASSKWQSLIQPDLLPYLIVGEEKKTHALGIYALALFWAIAITALAGPVWQQLPQAVKKRIDAQVIVLDLSLSMLATDLSPTRIARAKHKLSDLIDARKEGLTALVVYSGDAHVVSPLTDDSKTIASLLPSLGPELMSVPGSNASAGLSKAIELLQNAQSKQGSILFVTDGFEEQQISTIKKMLKSVPYRLLILGVGTAKGAPIQLPGGNFLKDRQHNIVIPKLNRDELIDLSQQVNGRYQDISNNDSDVQALLSTSMLAEQDAAYQETQRHFDLWQEEGPWLVLLLLPLVCLFFRRGALLLVLLVAGTLTLSPSSAEAVEWSDLWQTPDQKGQQLYDKGDYAAAAQAFESSEWKASSYYKKGDYDQAAKEFSQKSDNVARYNQANALAKTGRLEDAIALYDKVLVTEPNNSDAQFNRDLLKKLLQMKNAQRNQQQQKGQQGQNADQNAEQENSSNASNDNQNQSGQNKSSQNNSSSNSEQTSESSPSSQNQQQQNSNSHSQNQTQEPSQKNEESEASAQQKDPSTGQEKPAQANEPANASDTQSQENQQALEQWLRRVPDEPGGLLRRKFFIESRRKQTEVPEQTW